MVKCPTQDVRQYGGTRAEEQNRLLGCRSTSSALPSLLFFWGRMPGLPEDYRGGSRMAGGSRILDIHSTDY